MMRILLLLFFLYFVSALCLRRDPRHPWDWGCYDDREPVEICRQAGVRLRRMDTKLTGCVYFISASPDKDGTGKTVTVNMPDAKGSAYFIHEP